MEIQQKSNHPKHPSHSSIKPQYAMEWTQESPGKFVGELGGIQKIYRHVSQLFSATGCEHWGLYCSCTLELSPGLLGKGPGLILRSAWKALRYEFPGLAVALRDENTKTYEIPTTESVEAWVQETFVVQRTSQLDDIIASYPPKDTPTLYFFPDSSTVLLLVSHWRIDALGTCMLLDRLFTLVAAEAAVPQPELRLTDLERISPPIEDAVGAPSIEESSQNPALEQFARQSIKDHHEIAVNAGGLPFKVASSAERPSRAAITLSRSSTTTLMNACRERGITVTSAVHAALADTYFALNATAEPPPSNYACVMAVNMRDRLRPPYNGPQHAVQTYVTGVTPSVDRESSFEEKARHLTSYYKSWYSEEFTQAMRLTTKYHSDAMLNRPPPVPGAPAPKPPSSVTLSSLGVVEKYLQQQHVGGSESVTVTDFQFGVAMMTREILLYVWTFDGRLRLSANYNDAYHDKEEILDFLNFIRLDLEKELPVSMDLDD